MAKIEIKKHQGTIPKLLTAFIKRFHLLLFFVAVVGCLSVVIIQINKTLSSDSTNNATSTTSPGSLDSTTLQRIQSLHSSSQPASSPELPAGRSNPFSE